MKVLDCKTFLNCRSRELEALCKRHKRVKRKFRNKRRDTAFFPLHGEVSERGEIISRTMPRAARSLLQLSARAVYARFPSRYSIDRNSFRHSPFTRLGQPRPYSSVSASELRFGQPLHETHPHILEAGER